MICVKPYLRKIKGSGRDYVYLPCGQCVCCKVNKAREWSFRMMAESGYWPSSAFLTLTYMSDEVVSLDKRDLQLAFKRARKGGLQFRYFAAGEYGGETGRPHYHVCIFYRGDLGFAPDISFGVNNGHLSWWPHGITNVGSFTVESSRYVADYLLKSVGDPPPLEVAEPFRLVSQGLGKQYILDNRKVIDAHDVPYLRFKKSFIAIPRYYRKFLTTWVDEAGVTLASRRFIKSSEGGTIRFLESSWDRRSQRERNFTTRQLMHSKEF